MDVNGGLLKMESSLDDGGRVSYRLPVGDLSLPLHPDPERLITIDYSDDIYCIACGRKTKKSYSQGYCYPCSQSLARCDLCIVRPETCHYHLGTCREPEWGEANCMQRHYVYLSNTSGVKVGITRGNQIPTRWIDQGATQALPIFEVGSRLLSGRIETILKQHIADRTDWRRMLKGEAERIDLVARRDQLLDEVRGEIDTVIADVGDDQIIPITEAAEVDLSYPVLRYPEKVRALNLDKTPHLEGRLLGIKGQYLIFDCGVLNIRKYAGYQVAVSL